MNLFFYIYHFLKCSVSLNLKKKAEKYNSVFFLIIQKISVKDTTFVTKTSSMLLY